MWNLKIQTSSTWTSTTEKEERKKERKKVSTNARVMILEKNVLSVFLRALCGLQVCGGASSSHAQKN